MEEQKSGAEHWRSGGAGEHCVSVVTLVGARNAPWKAGNHGRPDLEQGKKFRRRHFFNLKLFDKSMHE